MRRPWVLTRGYRLASITVAGAMEALADSSDIDVQDEELVRTALADVRDGADFADALISQTCRSYGCSTVVSFDRTAQKHLRFQAP